jgi:hypothetical protein
MGSFAPHFYIKNFNYADGINCNFKVQEQKVYLCFFLEINFFSIALILLMPFCVYAQKEIEIAHRSAG